MPYNNLYIVGNFNGWEPSTAPEFTKISTNIFQITINLTAGNQFKFMTERDWTAISFGSNIFSINYTLNDLTTTPYNNIICPNASTYTITVNLNEIKTQLKKHIL